MIYLASPYSHDDPDVREYRYHEVSKQTALLMKARHLVFCPIAFSHPLATTYGVPNTHAQWVPHNKAMIDICDEVWVLMIDGVEDSVGIKVEIEYARKIGRPVYTIMPGQTKHQQELHFGKQAWENRNDMHCRLD